MLLLHWQLGTTLNMDLKQCQFIEAREVLEMLPMTQVVKQL